MPWTVFLLVAILCGLNCGRSMIDLSLRQLNRQYTLKDYNEVDFTKSAKYENAKELISPDKQRCSNILTFFLDTSDARKIFCEHYSSEKQNNIKKTDVTSDLNNKISGSIKINEIGILDNQVLTELFEMDSPYSDEIKTITSISRIPYIVKDNIISPQVVPFFMPPMNYNDFYRDLLPDIKSTVVKRTEETTSCDCKITNDLIDLGHQHFPRYLLSAVCQSKNKANTLDTRCWHGATCKPLKYKIKVLRFRDDKKQQDPTLVWLPDDLKHFWQFKTVTVTAGCICGN